MAAIPASTQLSLDDLGVWWDDHWLPRYPLAADDFDRGVYRMGRDQAAARRYVEANPQAVSNLLVVDVDHPDALLRAIADREGWRPNLLVENPHNGHAHGLWALREPVTRTEYARRKPLAYAAAVTEGLRRSVGGDKGYSGLLTKNPTHYTWEASWFTDHLYGLDELDHHLTGHGSMPPASWHRTKRRQPVGLGRNCTIFETASRWAFREVRRHFGDPHGLWQAISVHTHELNADYSEPLPHNEAHHIAASIHRWITTRSRMWADGPVVYEANLSTIQAARGRNGGRKSGRSRRGDKYDRVQQAIQEARQ